MLSAAAWAVLAALPAVVVLLYFLKLRRTPVEVPSTYLWARSVEDLHVNSIWQRLRRNLLLLLQLLLLALVILSLLGIAWRGSDLVGNRFIFLVDNSASMAATDVEGTRLAAAKREVEKLIDQMRASDSAMIVSFAAGARVEQPFTGNRALLRRQLAAIEQTDEPTSIAEALRVASGLANASRGAVEAADDPAANPPAASLYIATDARFSDVAEFSFGNLDPQPLILVGQPQIDNVAILAFSTAKKQALADATQAFARIENFGAQEVVVPVELYLDGRLIDAQESRLPPQKPVGVAFDLEGFDAGVLEIRVAAADDLAIDNRAWTTLHPPRRSRVLLVTAGNQPLEFALSTEGVTQIADVRLQSPEYLSSAAYRQLAEAGEFDLIIYDRCAPATMPAANTLFVGAMPSDTRWKANEPVEAPAIIDSDRAHPLTQLIDLGDVLVVEAAPLVIPEGGASLVDSTSGSLLAIAPRDSYEDAVLAFPLIGASGAGTNWPVRLSFPLFVLNAVRYFGGGESSLPPSVRVGDEATLRLADADEAIDIVPPGEAAVEVESSTHGTYHFSGTRRVGVYHVLEAKQPAGSFAVNLFDASESDAAVRPDEKLVIGQVELAGTTAARPAERQLWKWLALAAIAVLVFEWYIYNRRVYI